MATTVPVETTPTYNSVATAMNGGERSSSIGVPPAGTPITLAELNLWTEVGRDPTHVVINRVFLRLFFYIYIPFTFAFFVHF